MKKRKTNIYLHYFSSQTPELTQSQKRLALCAMSLAGLVVLYTIFGSLISTSLTFIGGISVAVLLSLILTECLPADKYHDTEELQHDENY